ncbi:condensation domain-containing protein [Streptomyces sp. NPDC101149]|uniref:condensation domain-containing protein n=1 Tax=Streptomyces sp. NPDC101149 TaxID=3366113 RepID=UPI00382B1CA0
MTHNQIGRLAATEGLPRKGKPPITFGLRLEGPVDPERIERTLTGIARRHTALRTWFPASLPPGWAQCVQSDWAAWPLDIVDLTGLLEPQRAQAQELVHARLDKPFAPDRFPLFRAFLVRTERESSLLIAVDHSIFDGASVQAFLDDFGDVYRSEGPTGCGPVSTGSDVTEFGAYEREWLAGSAADAALAHWKGVWDAFGPFPVTHLPLRTGVTGTGAEWKRVIPAQRVTDRQRTFPGGYISAPTLAAAAVVTALRDVTGQDETGLLHPSSRRFFDGGEKMIGYLNNRVLLRVATPAHEGFLDIADRTRTAMLESLEHDMMPFEVLLRELAPHVTDRRPEHPYVHLNVETMPVAPDLPDLRAQHFWPAETAGFGDLPWISMNLEIEAERMVLRAGYSIARFAPETVTDLMERVRGYLTGVDDAPE